MATRKWADFFLRSLAICAGTLVCGRGIDAFADQTALLGAEQIVERYKATLSVYAQAEFKATEETFTVDETFTNETLTRRVDWHYRSDGRACKVNQKGMQIYLSPSTKSIRQAPFDYEFSVDKSGLIFVEEEKETDTTQHSISALLYTELRPIEKLAQDGEFMLIYGYVRGNGDEGAFLPNVLSKSRLSVRADKLGDQDLVRLESRGKFGLVMFWLDPSANFLPRRIEMSKQSEHIFGERPLKKYSGLAAVTYVADMQIVKSNEGEFLINAIESILKRNYFNRVESERRVVTIRDIDLSPTHLQSTDFEITKAISNGTVVHVTDDPTIVYEWNDGKIVKSINSAAIDAFGDLTFGDNDRGARSVILIVTNAAIVAVLLVLLARRYRNQEPQ